MNPTAKNDLAGSIVWAAFCLGVGAILVVAAFKILSVMGG